MLVLRPMKPEDETAVEAAHVQLVAEGFSFLFDRDRVDTFAEYLALLERQRAGEDRHAGRVRASFLVAEVEGQIVGRVSIRHELNASLELEGGHVGYSVLPAHRRRGYATQMLRRALEILADGGLATALVTCDDDNQASISVIERCGGSLAGRVSVGGKLVRHFLVPTSVGEDGRGDDAGEHVGGETSP